MLIKLKGLNISISHLIIYLFKLVLSSELITRLVPKFWLCVRLLIFVLARCQLKSTNYFLRHKLFQLFCYFLHFQATKLLALVFVMIDQGSVAPSLSLLDILKLFGILLPSSFETIREFFVQGQPNTLGTILPACFYCQLRLFLRGF